MNSLRMAVWCGPCGANSSMPSHSIQFHSKDEDEVVRHAVGVVFLIFVKDPYAFTFFFVKGELLAHSGDGSTGLRVT